jgi:hypothetical protein
MTVPGIGPGTYDKSALARAQESQAQIGRHQPTLFRLYTESRENIPQLVSRYFEGFTVYRAVGYWQGQPEASDSIDILTDSSDIRSIFYLAEDIRRENAQQCVVVTWFDAQGLHRFDVTENVVSPFGGASAV